MNSLTEVKDIIEKQGRAWNEYKKTNDLRIAALESGDFPKAAQMAEKLNRIEADVSNFSKIKDAFEADQQILRDRIEQLEASASSPGRTPVHKESDEYRKAFCEWIRSQGKSTEHEVKMQDLYRKLTIRGDVTIGTGAAGGYAVPKEIAAEIELQEKKFSPVRRLVKVVQTGTSDYKELVNIRGTTSGWVGETGTRSATATPQLREIAPTQGELYAYPQVSEWSLDDIFFNVESWLAENVAQEFAIQEGDAVIRGNGTSKPTGMINTAPTSTDDFASPLRAAAVYQFVPSAASPDAILPDTLIDLIYKLNSAYRAMATFVMNSVTTGAIRKLKDTTNQYLWQPSLQIGQPNLLHGYPIETWEQMDDVGTNKYPVAFGNFRRGYLLVERVGLRITRDNVTNVGFVRFYVRRREGGIVLNNDAIKFLKTT